MTRQFAFRLSRLARRLGLIAAVLALLAAPIGSISHASASDAVPHDHAAVHHGLSASSCDPTQHHDASNRDGAGGADCCMAFCHVVSGPLAAPLTAALDILSPRLASFALPESRLPGGLNVPPLLGPPRSDS